LARLNWHSLMLRAVAAMRMVLMDSAWLDCSRERVVSITILNGLEKYYRSILVSLQLLKHGFEPLFKSMMTLFRNSRDLLIVLASSNSFPSTPVLSTLSDPARSTNRMFLSPSIFRMMNKWDLDDSALDFVLAFCLLVYTLNMSSWNSIVFSIDWVVKLFILMIFVSSIKS